jgi:hypothetical protein
VTVPELTVELAVSVWATPSQSSVWFGAIAITGSLGLSSTVIVSLVVLVASHPFAVAVTVTV